MKFYRLMLNGYRFHNSAFLDDRRQVKDRVAETHGAIIDLAQAIDNCISVVEIEGDVSWR